MDLFINTPRGYRRLLTVTFRVYNISVDVLLELGFLVLRNRRLYNPHDGMSEFIPHLINYIETDLENGFRFRICVDHDDWIERLTTMLSFWGTAMFKFWTVDNTDPVAMHHVKKGTLQSHQ